MSRSAAQETRESGARVGQLLAGKYRLLRSIGQGGMGEVYEAQHVVVGRRFAVKFLRADLVGSESAIARFRREAQAAGALESEHIAAVTDFDSDGEGTPFMVMEFLNGVSLAELLERDGALPVGRAVGAILQVCHGLAAAHATGIVHRDLKPANLFVCKRSDGSDLVKILDFGIAKLLGAEGEPSITQSGALLGTPFYMSPEQARGERSLGEATDIYALGVILYELLSGQKPHPGDSYNSILAHILTEPVVPLATLRPGLPSGLTDLVGRALALDEAKRPATVESLARELSAFVGCEVAPPAHSQFAVRAALESALTLPSEPTRTRAPTRPAAHVSVRARAPRSAERRQLVWLIAGLLGIGLSALVWRATRSERAEAPGPAQARPSAEPEAAALAPMSSAVASAMSSATPGAPTADAEPARTANTARASSAPGAPGPLPTVRSPRGAATPKRAPARPSTAASAASASTTGSRRLKFDENNPY